MTKAILSPCIGVCTLDAQGLCTGCFRSTEEIANWLRYSDAQRARLMDDVLPEREAAVVSAGVDASPPAVLSLETPG